LSSGSVDGVTSWPGWLFMCCSISDVEAKAMLQVEHLIRFLDSPACDEAITIPVETKTTNAETNSVRTRDFDILASSENALFFLYCMPPLEGKAIGRAKFVATSHCRSVFLVRP
jgi:hypothetical protein